MTKQAKGFLVGGKQILSNHWSTWIVKSKHICNDSCLNEGILRILFILKSHKSIWNPFIHYINQLNAELFSFFGTYSKILKTFPFLTVGKNPTVHWCCSMLHGRARCLSKSDHFQYLKKTNDKTEETRRWCMCVCVCMLCFCVCVCVNSSECNLWQTVICCRAIYLCTVCWFKFSLC